MEQPTAPLGERRSEIEGAVGALTGLGEVLHQASGAELAELMGIIDGLAAQAAAARVTITAEALTRGEIAASGTNARTWVRDHAPSLRQGGAGHVASVAAAITGGGALWHPDGPGLDPDSPLGMLSAGVTDGTVTPMLAAAAMRELERLDPHLRDEAKPTVARSLLDLGIRWGPSTMRRLRPRLLAEYGHPGELDDLQQRLAGAARLSAPFVESGDLTEYQLLMTPEQATVLEAAIGRLSAPAPDDETGERDLRPAGQRRVEALTEVCRRSSSIDAAAAPDGAAGAAAAVHVTIALSDLEGRTGCGEVMGSTATGTVLSPETLRRITCEADLVPHVLGTEGELLDLGRVARLFTRAQRRRLWRRDGCCTYPGCDAPPAWAQAHHVRHWADGGLTDIDNAALLCQRHHTVVHQRRLMAEVLHVPDEEGRHVVWDLGVGSYDRHLERLRAEAAAHDPPPLTPERVQELLAAIGGDDPDESRWAEIELWAARCETDDDGWDRADHPERGGPPMASLFDEVA
ncbi:HNH endonuclease [Phycicoccus sp. CSK15P-2]|uniref:HNH endonuclease signature motif containing protein n=1 Tax=Phycicoccus sp. CSK15P-2 TaxID=2807627 RepID=UPI00194E5438|nr:HNH endonuclease signature motif containing protein [Phycicoccus sp. CSK15P-2]MBM6404159.1 HNH endonuclease [Phycicoccus sp. CSK15P-2]